MSQSTRSVAKLQPLDRTALVWMSVLALLTVLLLFGGDRTAPRVRDFNWQSKQIGAEDAAFILTFSRPMDHPSVERNLQISPALPGKVSWAGRRMAYTLTTPAPYGQSFAVQLQDARDRIGAGIGQTALQPFAGQFQTRDRSFAYIGVDGDEEGRLITYNLTRQQKQILTPKELLVMDFKPYPLSDRILFAATDRAARSQGIVGQKLYTVTTGIQLQPPQLDSQLLVEPIKAQPAEKVELVLDSGDYQNLRFELSADGKTIVVQRVNSKTAEFGPWIIRTGSAPEPLKGEPGGDFLITPDSNSLAIAQGQGLAILPLQPDAKPLDFLPKFGTVLDFSRDGSLAAMLKFNGDRTKSLYLVNNQGIETELFRTNGSIRKAEFDPTKQIVYCLLTELITNNNLYQERPYLAAIDLKTKQQTPLAVLPMQQDIEFSLSPDGLAILVDEAVAVKDGNLPDASDKAIASSRLWLLPLTPTNPTAKLKPESLPLPGLHPRWLP
jgi:hypothetical protein